MMLLQPKQKNGREAIRQLSDILVRLNKLDKETKQLSQESKDDLEKADQELKKHGDS